MSMPVSGAYPSPAQAAIVAAAERLMEETMARFDPSHDAFHVRRVRRTALALAHALRDQNPDLLVVELSALLHDVLDKKYAARAHADTCAFLQPFFLSVAPHADLVASGQAALVARIVDNVSWSTEEALRAAGSLGAWHAACAELHCVQDADRLDALGAMGIMRCAAYSAATNRPLHVPKNDPQYPKSAIAHFHDKLLHIRDRLKTEPGRKLGETRHKFLLDFLDAADREFHAVA